MSHLLEMLEQPTKQPGDFGPTDSQAAEILNNDSASVASHESADADVSEQIREVVMNPWSFDPTEAGRFTNP